MKICFVVQDMSIGGSSTVVHEILKNWSCKSDELFLVSFFNNFDLKYNDLYRIKNLRIILLNKRSTVDFVFIKHLKKILMEISPDAISSHLTCTFYLKMIGADRVSKIFHTIHSEPRFDLPFLYRIFLKKSFQSGKISLIGCCDYISSSARELYNAKCITINNGIDISKERTKNEKENKETVFTYLGRFDRIKNVTLLVDAFGLLNNANSKLMICGFGKEEDAITNSINRNKNKSKICFLGKINDISEILKRTDVLCLASDREGLPMTVLEGINYGLCFLTTNVGGISEYVVDGVNGYYIDKNIIDISKKMSWLCSNPALLKKYKKNSALFLNKIDAKEMASKYLEVIKKSIKL